MGCPETKVYDEERLMMIRQWKSLALVAAAIVAFGCGTAQDEASQAEEYAEEAADAMPVDEVERYRVVVVPEGLTWEDAKQRAEADGGHLVTIGSAEENAIVHALIADNPDVWYDIDVVTIVDGEENPVQVTSGPWIGLYQPEGSPEPDGGWMWVTGEAAEYTNWSTGAIMEPNDLGGVEHYGQFFGQGLGDHADGWNDASNDVTTDLTSAEIEITSEVQNPRGYIVEFE